jgi:hypothetical protein
MSRFSLPALRAHFKKPNGQPIKPLQQSNATWSVRRRLMPRRRGLRPRLLAAVIRSKATLAFAAERQVVGRTIWWTDQQRPPSNAHDVDW